MYSESKKLLKLAGFNLRKFASNASDLNRRVAQDESMGQSVISGEETFAQVTLGDQQRLQENELKVLGVKWNISLDQLSYNFDSVLRALVNIESTKRNIVSVVGKFYDPIGI